MESELAKNTYNYQYLRMSLLCDSAAIKKLLQQNLLRAIALSELLTTATNLLGDTGLTSDTIPVHRLSDDTAVLYRSAIALKLAPLCKLNTLDIPHHLIGAFPTISQNTTGQICLDFSVEIVAPGWIHFRLSHPSLALWLQQFIQATSQFKGAEVVGALQGSKINRGDLARLDGTQEQSWVHRLKDAPNLFPMQYAHARCCSLLRLAHHQGLIKLRDFDFKTLSGQIIEPNPIPWLNDDPMANTGQVSLRLEHPAERRLIAQMLDLQDAITAQDPITGIKLASGLSDAFEKFYSSCRIWGEVKTQTPKLAQARLGLVGVTQVLLRSLLEDQLGIPMPVEL